MHLCMYTVFASLAKKETETPHIHVRQGGRMAVVLCTYGFKSLLIQILLCICHFEIHFVNLN